MGPWAVLGMIGGMWLIGGFIGAKSLKDMGYTDRGLLLDIMVYRWIRVFSLHYAGFVVHLIWPEEPVWEIVDGFIKSEFGEVKDEIKT